MNTRGDLTPLPAARGSLIAVPGKRSTYNLGRYTSIKRQERGKSQHARDKSILFIVALEESS